MGCAGGRTDSGRYEWLESEIALRSGQDDRALELLGIVAEKMYSDHHWYREYARLTERLGKMEQARLRDISILDFNMILQPKNENGARVFDVGQQRHAQALVGQYLETGSIERARAFIETGMDSGAADQGTIVSGSQVLLAEGELQQATAWAELALQIEPDDPSALAAQAGCLKKAGKLDEALDVQRAASQHSEPSGAIDLTLFSALMARKSGAKARDLAHRALAHSRRRACGGTA